MSKHSHNIIPDYAFTAADLSGIADNGLLVKTCSMRNLKDLSGFLVGSNNNIIIILLLYKWLSCFVQKRG
jgi:hypothetical protein